MSRVCICWYIATIALLAEQYKTPIVAQEHPISMNTNWIAERCQLYSCREFLC